MAWAVFIAFCLNALFSILSAASGDPELRIARTSTYRFLSVCMAGWQIAAALWLWYVAPIWGAT